MPVQKGKRRNRTKRRTSGRLDDGAAPVMAAAPQPARTARPASTPARPRWPKPPLWVNLALGVGMLLFGVVFFVLPQKGVGNGQRIIFLVLYLAVAALYLRNAILEIRERRQ